MRWPRRSYLAFTSFIALLGSACGARAAVIPPFQPAQIVFSENISQMKGVGLAVGPSGARHMVVIDFDGALYRAWYLNASDPPLVLASGADLGNFSDIAFDANGGLHVVYRRNGGGQSAIEYRKKLPGQAWTPEAALVSGINILFGPTLSVEPDGALNLVYTEFTGQSLIRSLRVGQSATTVATLSGLVSATHARGPDGTLTATYSILNATTSKSELYLVTRPVGGSWGTPVMVAETPFSNSMFAPNVAIDPLGRWHITYVQSIGANGAVQYRNATAGPITLALLPTQVGSYSAIDVDATGAVHLAYETNVISSPQDAQATTRNVLYTRQCYTGRTKSYPMPGCLKCCPDSWTDWACYGCFSPTNEFEDQAHNKFVITCVTDPLPSPPSTYYCLTWHPLGGSPAMVGKCPWGGGMNDFMFYGVPGTDPDRPAVFTTSWQTSLDDACDDYHPVAPCPGGGSPPCPDGRDQLDFRFDVCPNNVRATHTQSLPVVVPGATTVEVVNYSPPPSTCNFANLIPNGPGFTGCPIPNGIFSGMPEVLSSTGMGPVTTALTLAGSLTGGEVRVQARDLEIAVPSSSGETLVQLASTLESAINGSAAFAGIGIHAHADLNTLYLFGVPASAVGARATDAGLVTTPAPTGLAYAVRDTFTSQSERHIDVTWSNQGAYDRFELSKDGHLLAVLPGGTTSFTDTEPWDFAQDYRVVAWKNGMPSSRVALPEVAAAPAPSPGTTGGLTVVAYPNPFREAAALSYYAPRPALLRVTIVDVMGRRVLSSEREITRPGWNSFVWDGRDDRGAPAEPGTYFYRVSLGEVETSGRLVLVH